MFHGHGTYWEKPKLTIQNNANVVVKGNQNSYQNKLLLDMYLCLEAADRFRMKNYTSNHPPSAFLTPTQEKIALLELKMCYLQVRIFLSHVRIIRFSKQTCSWANPTFKVPFRFLVVWLGFIFFNDCWNVDELKNDDLDLSGCLEFDCFCLRFCQQPNKFQWKNVSDELSS